MDIYKQKNVSVRGPIEEKVISTDANTMLARAKYKYNARNQLIQTDYFLGGRINGKRKYLYSQDGLYKENVYNAGGDLVEVITYQKNSQGKIISYRVAPGGIRWDFKYKGSFLKSGKRFARDGGKTESFILQVRNKSIRIQDIFSGDDKKIASVWHIYKKNKLVERVRIEGSGKKKVKYIYINKGGIQEILWYEQTNTGKFKLVRKHKFVY